MRSVFCIVLVLCLCQMPLHVLAVGEGDSVWRNNGYERRVLQVGHRIMQANGISEAISFSVSGSKIPNAGANDYNNTIQVDRGLLVLIESDDELAAVVGHEIAHILQNHGKSDRLHRLKNSLLVTSSALLGYGVGALPALLYSKHSIKKKIRDNETEADEIGVDIMVKAGYNPWAAERIFSKILSDGTAATFVRTHPKAKDRIPHIQQYIASHYPQFPKYMVPNSFFTPIVTTPLTLQVSSELVLEDTEDDSQITESPGALNEIEQRLIQAISQRGYIPRAQLHEICPNYDLVSVVTTIDGLIQKKMIRMTGQAPQEIYLLTEQTQAHLHSETMTQAVGNKI